METKMLSMMCLLFALMAVVAGIVGFVMLLTRKAPRPARLDRVDSKPSPIPADRRQPVELVSSQCPSCGADLPADSPMGLCAQCLMQCALSKQNNNVQPGDQGATSAYRGPSSAPAVATLAPLFPQLEILELIGQGGMGAVYKARQTKLDRLVAIKILPAEWGNDTAFAERFTREARALARLSHSQIVAIHDFGESGGLFYLIMEYVDGCNLRQLLRSGPLQPELALSLIPQICAALQYAHGEGVVHRDIKPENILLDAKGQVKIADFGLAKLTRKSAAEYTLTGTQQVMGTIDYMAPEQRTSPQDVDHRADIYAVGVVLYEMLTGELPLGRFAPPSEKAQVDERFDAVVFRAMEKEPAQRYQRISEVQADVQAISWPASGNHAGRSVGAAERKPVGGIRAKARSILGGMVTLFVHRPTAVSAPSVPQMRRENAKPEKRQQTPIRQGKSTDIPVVLPVRRARHKGAWAGVVIPVAGMVFVLGVIFLTGSNRGCVASKVDSTAGVRKDEKPNDASRVDGTASLAFHRGDIALIGVRDAWNHPDVERENKIRGILRTADQEYLKLELRYTKRIVNDDGKTPLTVTVTVMPFINELKTLEMRVWGQVGIILGQYPVCNDDNAWKLLAIRGSLFPLGSEEVTIELSRRDKTLGTTRDFKVVDDVFRWRFTKPGDPGEGQWFEGRQLPPEYARFWIDDGK